MDQATLAGLVGRSQGWLSRIESGRLRLDRTTDVEALAAALEVHPGDITGRPHRPAGGRTYEIEALIPAIRVALIDEVPDAPPRPVVELTDRVQRLSRLMWRDGDLTGLAAALPEVLGEVRLASVDGGTEEDRRQALQLLAVVTSVAFPMLKNLGHTDLALVAANRSVAAADELGDPLWRAYASFRRSHALIPAGSPVRALEVAGRAVDQLEPHVGDVPAALRMYGMTHLTTALWAARAGQQDAATATSLRPSRSPVAWARTASGSTSFSDPTRCASIAWESPHSSARASARRTSPARSTPRPCPPCTRQCWPPTLVTGWGRPGAATTRSARCDRRSGSRRSGCVPASTCGHW
jgi:hypothetical protein